MDKLKLDDLKRLIASQSGHRVSLYLPTHAGGVGGEEDAPRLLRLLDRAEAELVAHGLRSPEAREFLAPARVLPADKAFWKQRHRSLAVFLSANLSRTFRLSLDLPETLAVGRRFHIKPLLPLLVGHDRFFILALSQNRVRLIRAGKYSAEETPVPEMPSSVKEAPGPETADRGEQVHSAANLGSGLGTARKQAAVFHGHGGHRDTAKQDLTRFFRLVDDALHETLREQQTPLVLAGVDYLLPLFHDVCTYPHVLTKGVHGNFDRASPAELRDRAWPVVEPRLLHVRQESILRYRELVGSRLAVCELSDVLAAASAGRVEALFVDPRHEIHGEYDAASGKQTPHRSPHSDDDLVELAVIQTLLKRGAVYSIDETEAKVDAPLCALLRY
jgi:hypothetical protein